MEELQDYFNNGKTDLQYRLLKTDDYTVGYCEISGVKSHKIQHETAYKLLYTVLSDEFGVDLKTLVIARKEDGKPYAAGESFFFNLSHCDGLAVCAVSAGQDIGVDVEQIRECREATAKRVMSDSEYASFLTAVDKNKAFFRIWTYKESVLKLTGEGLRRAPREIDSAGNTGYRVEQYEITFNGKEFIISCAIN